VKDEMIEIQGDHRTKIQEVLSKLGYKSKVSGG
jgi:translation initiation factor 1